MPWALKGIYFFLQLPVTVGCVRLRVPLAQHVSLNCPRSSVQTSRVVAVATTKHKNVKELIIFGYLKPFFMIFVIEIGLIF